MVYLAPRADTVWRGGTPSSVPSCGTEISWGVELRLTVLRARLVTGVTSQEWWTSETANVRLVITATQARNRSFAIQDSGGKSPVQGTTPSAPHAQEDITAPVILPTQGEFPVVKSISVNRVRAKRPFAREGISVTTQPRILMVAQVC